MTDLNANTADQWTIEDAKELYALETWGDGFFSINSKGHVSVKPIEGADISVDLMDVIDEALQDGSTLPLLVRFQDIISSRVKKLNRKFRDAIEAAEYQGRYRSIFPIKVNQLQEVVVEVMDAGKEFDIGLECGSKAELMAALPMIGTDTLLSLIHI